MDNGYDLKAICIEMRFPERLEQRILKHFLKTPIKNWKKNISLSFNFYNEGTFANI